MNKNGVIPSNLIGPIAKLLVPEKKVNFDYKMILIVIIGMTIKCTEKKLQYTMISF